MNLNLNKLILIGMAVFLFGAASNTQSGWQYMITSIIIATLLFGYILPLIAIRNIEIEKYIPSRLFVGKDVKVELIVKNLMFSARHYLNVKDLPVSIRHEMSNNHEKLNIIRILLNKIEFNIKRRENTRHFFIKLLKPGETLTFDYNYIPIERGVYTTGDMNITTSTPFGLFTSIKKLKKTEEVVIYPKILPVRGGWVSRIAQRSVAQELSYIYIPTSIPGTTRNLREYVSGDSPRHIHWPNSAKTGRLMVREFEIESSGHVILALDSAPGYKNKEFFELAVTTVASLLNICHQRGLIAQFITQDDAYEYSRPIVDDDWDSQLEILARVKYISKKNIYDYIDNLSQHISARDHRLKPVFVLISSDYPGKTGTQRIDIVSIVVSPGINSMAHYNITSETDLKYI